MLRDIFGPLVSRNAGIYTEQASAQCNAANRDRLRDLGLMKPTRRKLRSSRPRRSTDAKHTHMRKRLPREVQSAECSVGAKLISEEGGPQYNTNAPMCC
jgi:hypothetical protein